MMKQRLEIARRISSHLQQYLMVGCEYGTFLVMGNTANPRHMLDAFSGYISREDWRSGKQANLQVRDVAIRITKIEREVKLSNAHALFMSCMRPVYAAEVKKGYSSMGIKVFTVPIFVKFGPGVEYSQLQK